ncbi:MAG: hypothetical protein IPG79_13325 [Saprospiraceae bacterium]|nr:hypothetical protein [Saprospiraceae bacterium]
MTYYNPLCNYANGIVHDWEIAEDIVQEVFINVEPQRAHRFRTKHKRLFV